MKARLRDEAVDRTLSVAEYELFEGLSAHDLATITLATGSVTVRCSAFTSGGSGEGAVDTGRAAPGIQPK